MKYKITANYNGARIKRAARMEARKNWMVWKDW